MPNELTLLGVVVVDAPGGGALVRAVRPHGPADGALEPGDVILRSAEGQSGERRRSGRSRLDVHGPVLLRIRRGNAVRYVGIDVAGRPDTRGKPEPKGDSKGDPKTDGK